jgi:hypothetical protein
MSFYGRSAPLRRRVAGTPRLIPVPESDADFAAAVRNAASRLNGNTGSAASTMIEILEHLIPHYPELEVRQQDGLASYEYEPSTWYVFRDGSRRR